MAKKTELEDRVKWLLLLGVLSSVLIMFVGLVMYMAHPAQDDNAIPIARIPAELADGNPVAVIDLGIIILIATPVMRVIIVSGTLAEKREYLFAALGALVLIILFVSFYIAGR